MSKIKIKDIEGETDELVKIFSNSDCSLADYLNANKKPQINGVLFLVFVIIYIILACVLFCLPPKHELIINVLKILSFPFAGITILFTHLYWRNITATVIAGLVSMCFYLVSIGTMSPEEAGLKINQKIENISIK